MGLLLSCCISAEEAATARENAVAERAIAPFLKPLAPFIAVASATSATGVRVAVHGHPHGHDAYVFVPVDSAVRDTAEGFARPDRPDLVVFVDPASTSRIPR